MKKMFDIESVDFDFQEGDGVAVYDEATRILMCFFVRARKDKLVAIPVVTRHRPPDMPVYILDDDILIVKTSDGRTLCDIENYEDVVLRDSDLEEESSDEETDE